MAKTKISEYSSSASSNTDVNNINIDEGCSPAGINNAIRTLMGHLKDFQTGTSSDSLTVGGSLTVTGNTALNGDTTAVTTAPTENSTKVATTAYVKTNLGGLGTLSTQNSSGVSITGGTIAGVSIDGTTTTQATADNSTKLASTAYVKSNITALSLGTNSTGNRTISTSAPTGGSSGDIWYKY